MQKKFTIILFLLATRSFKSYAMVCSTIAQRALQKLGIHASKNATRRHLVKQQKATASSNLYSSDAHENPVTFHFMKKISDITWQLIRKEQENARAVGTILWARDGRELWSGSNPYSDQTKQGFFLEYFHGHPESLWTPWGKVIIVDDFKCIAQPGELEKYDAQYESQAWDRIHTELSKRLKMSLYYQKTQWGVEQFGPVYAIYELDGLLLPQPKEKDQDQYTNHCIIDSNWKQLEKMYRSAYKKQI